MSITPKTRKIISKMHLSVLVFFILISLGCLLIGVPFQLYDKYVISRDAECFANSISPAVKNVDQMWTNVPVYNEYGRPAVILTLGPYGFIPDVAEDEKKCNVHTYEAEKNEKSLTLNIVSNSTIVDNSPRPAVPAYFGLFFLVISGLWFLFRKWIVWLNKD